MGVGGGFLNVPTLSILFSLDAASAIGTSLAVVFITALSGCIGYARQKRIFFRSAVLLAVPAVVGSVIGSAMTLFIPEPALLVIFASVLLLIGLRMVFPWIPFMTHCTRGPSFLETCTDCFGQCVTIRLYPLHLAIWGFSGGFLGGMTGMGGGIVNVPALVVAGMPIHYAIATSTLVIVLASGSAALVHAGLSHISPGLTVIYAIGGFFGAQVGSRMAPRISARTLHRMVTCLYFLLCCVMAGKAVVLLV